MHLFRYCDVSEIIPQCANIAIGYRPLQFYKSIHLKQVYTFLRRNIFLFYCIKILIFIFPPRFLMQYPKICIKYVDGNPVIDMHYCGCRHSESCSFPRKQYKLPISSMIIWITPEQTLLDMLYLSKDNIFLTS